jgi:hypothetical protein
MKREIRIEVFHSFEEENSAEYARRAAMTPEQRFAEFSALQEREWGQNWWSKPIVKIATWEKVDL